MDNGTDPDVSDKTVTLFLADGLTLATDIDGNPVATVQTDANGDYRFENLAAGDYVVMFEDSSAEGKVFVTPNQGGDDTIDSDVIAADGKTAPVTVTAGEETKDVDAGVVSPNKDPEPQDDAAAVCSDEAVTIDVLGNDTDPDSDVLTITAIDGQAIVIGGSVTLASGAVVTLNADATLSYDLSGDGDEFDALEIGQTSADQFSYTVEDGAGGSTSALVDVEIHGALNTLGTIAATLPADMTFTLDGFFVADAWTATLSGSGDPRFDGLQIGDAYCLETHNVFQTGVPIDANVFMGTDDLINPSLFTNDVVGNLDMINWIMNQHFTTVDNGDGGGTTYTDAEIQGAIWGLTDNIVFVADVPGNGTNANAQEIFNLAQANGEGFTPGEGDIFTIVLDPLQGQVNQQAFIVGLPFDDFTQDCLV